MQFIIICNGVWNIIKQLQKDYKKRKKRKKKKKRNQNKNNKMENNKMVKKIV